MICVALKVHIYGDGYDSCNNNININLMGDDYLMYYYYCCPTTMIHTTGTTVLCVSAFFAISLRCLVLGDLSKII